MQYEIKVTGIVQGVGFRPFIYRIAVKHNLVGYVRNRGDAVVEIVVEGKKNNIENFLKIIQSEKPILEQIQNMIISKKVDLGFKDFRIIKSSGKTKIPGSVIPTDVSICDECLKELRNPK